MGLISWILVGLIAGMVANLIYPGRSRGGLLGAMVLGILGAILGGFLFGLVTGQEGITGFDLNTIIVAVLGSLLLLFGFNALARGGRDLA